MRLHLKAFVFRLVLPLIILLALLLVAAFQLTSQVTITNGIRYEAVFPTAAPPNPKCPEVRSDYCVLANYQPAQAIVGFEDSVTLTTQGTVQFLFHVPKVCNSWQGPMSVSVYAPGRDFPLAKQVIETLRVRNPCVRKWTSWHLIFDRAHPPSSTELLNLAALGDNQVNSTYVGKNGLAYPINVARNVARLNANTKFLLASDIELYPSKDIISMFLNLVRKMQTEDPEAFDSKRQVFVLPVFEVSKGVQLPATKSQLVSLYERRQAVSFHRYMCNICHQIPKLSEWLKTNETRHGVMSVFLNTKRHMTMKLMAWEPFFIGTNEDPLFDERLSWNGKMNKMQLAYELCLMDYDFLVMDGAFLTHSPGIKVFSMKDQAPRVKYMRRNHAVYKDIVQELHDKHGTRDEC